MPVDPDLQELLDLAALIRQSVASPAGPPDPYAAAKKATGIGAPPERWYDAPWVKTAVEWTTGLPSDPGEEIGPFRALGTLAGAGLATRGLAGPATRAMANRWRPPTATPPPPPLASSGPPILRATNVGTPGPYLAPAQIEALLQQFVPARSGPPILRAANVGPSVPQLTPDRIAAMLRQFLSR